MLMSAGKNTLLRGTYRASITALAASLALAAPAKADEVVGRGSAVITKDTATTQSLAQREARREIVLTMLTKTIGHSRLPEVSAEIIDQMASQIRPDMLIDQQSERIGGDFVIHLTADIDQAWFRSMLSDSRNSFCGKSFRPKKRLPISSIFAILNQLASSGWSVAHTVIGIERTSPRRRPAIPFSRSASSSCAADAIASSIGDWLRASSPRAL
ncbi:hypothetical protein P8R33_12705 [Qipengyuania sp. XHP0211]|nr:hypothetical protein [Qipengyuania sp. XHP0211]